MNFGVRDFSRFEATDWRLWFLALMTATQPKEMLRIAQPSVLKETSFLGLELTMYLQIHCQLAANTLPMGNVLAARLADFSEYYRVLNILNSRVEKAHLHSAAVQVTFKLSTEKKRSTRMSLKLGE